ncbi:hypothetical protein B4099_2283 [Heyndrickxia coagulans]|uniref:Uncharacterized protein n=1 Tax=Heyndrickxia coagulans TaxID=1398 RepID=A0A150KB14_HEYCO|nr:hypothetical protein B4099_2283 [Heyndrickxia coagulans]
MKKYLIVNYITNNCLSIISPFSLFVFVYILNVYEAITKEGAFDSHHYWCSLAASALSI